MSGVKAKRAKELKPPESEEDQKKKKPKKWV